MAERREENVQIQPQQQHQPAAERPAQQQQPYHPRVIPPNKPTKQSKEESRISGTVKWFNAKYGYGFITRHDTNEDVFVHFSGIARKNPRHSFKSLGDGEIVEFNLMAASVTGPGGRPVKGNPYVSHRRLDGPRNRDAGAAGDNQMRDYIPPAPRTDVSGNTSSTEQYRPHQPQYDNRRRPGRGNYSRRDVRTPRFQ